jgi:hypothetical protein
MLHCFDTYLNASKTDDAQESDMAAIKVKLDGCVNIRPAKDNEDRAGIDYIATIKGGREVYIDLKTRTQGCSKYWKARARSGEIIPELAIETWSVCPNNRCPNGEIGWTLDYRKKTDLILYRFDPSDYRDPFLVPFHQLRMAAQRKKDDWKMTCKIDRQRNHSYYSESIFVRADWVSNAVSMVMFGKPVSERATYVQQLLFPHAT